ncbi:MAG: hypothetical protein RL442_2738 [Pseudomonadota bacterium]|jgi:hypothetical protein
MSTLFHLAASVDALLAAITTAWAALGEIVTAGALLLVLDRIAAAIRTVYSAGRCCGRIWFRHGQPALLAAADAVSWLLSQIDWAEVRATVAAGARVLIAAVITLALTAHQLVITTSAAMGRRYAALLTAPAPAAMAPAALAPLQHPLATVATELELLTRRELQALTGCRRKLPKAQLVTLAVAMA